MDNSVDKNYEIAQKSDEVAASDIQSEDVDTRISVDTADGESGGDEKTPSKKSERFYGITKSITSAFLQILSIFITSCAGLLTFFSCGVAGYGIIADKFFPDLDRLVELLSTALYNVVFFGVVICAVILLIVAIVPASLGLVASIASIRAFFRKMKQHRPKPWLTLCLGVVSFLIGIVNILLIFSVVVFLFGAFATFSVPSFFV